MSGSFKVKLKWPKEKKEANEKIQDNEITHEIPKAQKKRKTQRSCSDIEKGNKKILNDMPRNKKSRNADISSDIEETSIISKDYEITDSKKNTSSSSSSIKKQSKTTQKINKKAKSTEEKIKYKLFSF